MRENTAAIWREVRGLTKHKKRICENCGKRQIGFLISGFWICKECSNKENWGIELSTKRFVKREVVV